MSEQNKAIVRRFVEELDRLEAAPEELMAPGFTAHIATDPQIDLAGFKPFVGGFFSAFPHSIHDIEFEIAEGDKVAIRTTIRGIHKGDYKGIAPTGKELFLTGIAIFRIEGGKIAQCWSVPDNMGMLQQIGALPVPAQTAG